MKTKQDIYCNLKMDTLIYFKGDNIELLPNSQYTLIIDYPLEKTHAAIVKTGKKGMNYTALLQRIGKEYEFVYDYENKFGIWGHELGDLYLEQLHINHKTMKITLAVGS